MVVCLNLYDNVSVYDFLGKFVVYNWYFCREIVYISDIFYEFIFFFNV